MSKVSVRFTATVKVPRDELFPYFIQVDLPDLFRGYGPFPAVTETSNQTGPWDVPGSIRKVHLKNGETVTEEVTGCEAPGYFSYRVTDFTNVLRWLVERAVGQWWFEESNARTDLTWTYTFYARSWPALLLLYPVIKLLWQGYMKRALESFKKQAEQHISPV